MLSFRLTQPPVFGKAQTRTFIIINVFWIMLSTDVLGRTCCCQLPTVCFILMTEIHTEILYAHAGADGRSPPCTHTCTPQKQTQKWTCVAAAAGLEWQAKTAFTAANNLIHSWLYGFYSTHSLCATWKIYQNYSPKTACSQLEFRCHWENIWIFLYARGQ